MADQAKITSFDALETFRTHLILFLSKAHNRMDEVGDEIRRTRGWLQNDQRLHWEGEIRRRRRALEQAEQALLSAKLSSFKANHSMEMMAVRRAKRALVEAEEKLQNVKRWIRNYETCLDPFSRKLESLRGLLDYRLPKAIAFLLQIQKTLDSYMEAGAPLRAASLPAAPSDGGHASAAAPIILP